MPDEKAFSKLRDEERIKTEFSESSSFNRVLGIELLILCIVCLFITISTTDLMLFMPEVFRFQVAVLNINVNVLWFSIITPLAILFMHYNLLVNLQGHSYKLAR